MKKIFFIIALAGATTEMSAAADAKSKESSEAAIQAVQIFIKNSKSFGQLKLDIQKVLELLKKVTDPSDQQELDYKHIINSYKGLRDFLISLQLETFKPW